MPIEKTAVTHGTVFSAAESTSCERMGLVLLRKEPNCLGLFRAWQALISVHLFLGQTASAVQTTLLDLFPCRLPQEVKAVALG